MIHDKYDYWRLLWKLKQEYDKQYTGYYEPTLFGYSDSFDRYTENQYGLKILMDQYGNYTAEFKITDEAKYAWLVLKHA